MLSESGKRKFSEMVTNEAISLQGFTTGEKGTAEALFTDLIKEENTHKYCHISYTKRTFRNYMHALKLTEHEAVLKNTSRVTAFSNIRNHLTFCSMLETLQQLVEAENFHSTDDVSILADPMTKKTKVLLSAQAKQFLR